MMNDNQRRLLDEWGCLMLPEIIEHDTYQMVLEACLHRDDKGFHLFCRGNGGSSRDAYAIIDVIEDHSNVVGFLPGDACSMHAIIWAACAKRYVYPLGTIGLHMVALNQVEHIDAKYAASIAREYEASDRRNAMILATACTSAGLQFGCEFWLNTIRQNGSHGITEFDAHFLTTVCKMAQPASDYKKGL